MAVEFGTGGVVYKETITHSGGGVGGISSLRPLCGGAFAAGAGEPGSGLRFASACSEDELDRNWQRLILTHLEEKTHLGVLTGSPITDLSITLVAEQGHPEAHTRREATSARPPTGRCNGG